MTRSKLAGNGALRSFRDEFPVADRVVFLNHAGVAPTSTRVVEAVHEFMDSLAHLGRPSFDAWEDLARKCREQFARMVGAEPEEIAFVRNTSHGLSLLASGLNWRPGDRVAVAAPLEYPSNVYPWMDLARRGVVALDAVEADHGAVTVEAAARALRPATRVLATSSAQYATGAVADLDGLGALCRERGVLLCVDGIQTVGVLPTDVKKSGVHFLSADSHKWMLGMMGIGAVFVDRSLVEHVHPPLLGWRSTTEAFDFDRIHFELQDTAGRYEEGSLSYPLIAGFSAALALLEEAGIEAVADHATELVDHLARRLEALGCTTEPAPEHRRHILVFRHPRADPEQLLEGLADRGVIGSLRRGGVRLSPHLYNTRAEMEQVGRAVQDVLGTITTAPTTS